MKTFLRIAFVQLLACLTIGASAQTPTEQWSTPGEHSWVCPPGVTSVTLYIWSAGGAGAYYYSGAGGNLVHTTAIPVTGGQTYTIFVGYQVTTVDSASYSNSGFKLGDSTIVAAYGPYFQSALNGAPQPAPAWGGNYVYSQHIGGAGVLTQDGTTRYGYAGGGGAASDCSDGYPGNLDQTGGISVHCSGGFWGGDGGGYGQDGPGHASGAGAANGAPGVTKPGPALILMYYTCSGAGTTGTIGNAHTVAYPQELTPDKITSTLDPVLPTGSVIGWQQSTDNINFVTAKTADTTTTYRFDIDKLQRTTYYRRGNNACVTGGGFGNWSNTIKITVFTSTNGRNGNVTGYVKSKNGSSIFNRKVYAQSLTPLKGRAVGFLDSTFTDQQGHFSIDSIFYGDKNNGDSANVRFKVYPDTSNGHKYKPASALLSLSSLHPTYDLSSQPFFDTTVFAITGQVVQVCQGCLDSTGKVANITAPLDSVLITGVGKNNGTSNDEKDSVKTGYVSPPGQYGRYVLTLQEPDQYTLTPKFNAHKFVPEDSVFTVNNDVSNINFNDTTTHMISGFYGAGCNDVIGTAVLEFDDVLPNGYDGKPRASVFKKRVTTKANGHYSIRLPARPYTVKIISAKVSDKIDPSTTQASIKAFFKAVPASSLYTDITNGDTVLNLIYNRAPHIAVSGLYADSNKVSACSAFKNYDFWPQSIRRPVTFKVYQGPVSKGCLLDTGSVYVTTDISNTLGNYNHDTVKLSGGVGVDSIVAAQPNTVINPATGTYSKKFTATYTDILKRSVSTDTSKPALPIVVVTGAAIDPNSTNYVTVSPQLPFVVLHDPPGNASFSEWTQSVTSQQAISFEAENENSTGGFVNVEVGLDEIIGLFVEEEVSAWVSIDANFTTTNTTSNTSETVITNTAEKTLQTSGGGQFQFIGPNADLVYGAALNINYKLGTEIDWDSTHCQVLGPKPVMVTDIKKDTTSFLYTIGHIENELIPTLQQAADANAQTNPDSAAYYENQIRVWQQLVTNNEDNLKKAPVIQNLSFSNGGSQTYSNTLENSTTNTYNFNMEINRDLAVEAGFEIAGSGLSGGVTVGFKMSTGGSSLLGITKSTTTSYTLADDNGGGQGYEGDYLSVNVKKDPVYGTPMFETVAGGTQCPYEDGTVALDQPVLTANVQSLTGVKKDTANFTLYLNNLSLDPTPGGARPYILFLNASSNPSGATVLIGGTSSPDGVTYIVPNNGGVQPVTISVIRNTAGGVYDYDNLQFIMSDACFPPVVQGFFSNGHQYSTIQLSADFASPVSGATITSPANNWIANQASNNVIAITFNGYDTTKLASIAVQSNIPGTSTWKTLKTYTKKQLGKTSTTYSWNITAIADGPMNIRLMIKDKSSNTVYSTVSSGIIARTPPALYGTPQPANGIYTAGTQISYSYTKNIVNTNLKSSMVHMKDLTTNTTVSVQLSAFGNTMIIVPSGNISANVGDLYRVIADSVTDLYGNVKTAPDTSYFTVQSSNFSTASDALNVTTTPSSIYEDAKGVITVRFTRNSAVSDTTVIYYTLAGNAVYNKDYTVTYNNKGQSSATGISGAQGAILMPKDSSKVTMYIHPVKDSIVAPDKILSIFLSQGGGYSIGSNYKISDTILNHNTVAPVITANKSTTLCAGDSVTLSTAKKINGVGVKSYLWSTGAKTQSINVKTSGSYTVNVTDSNGFTGYSVPTVVTFICGSPSGLVATVLSKAKAVLKWDTATCAKKYVVQYRQSGTTAWTSDTVTKNRDTITGLKANATYQWQVASICRYPAIIISSYTPGTNFTTPVSFADVVVSGTPDYTKAAAGDGFSAGIYPNPASTSARVEVKGVTGSYSVILTNLQGEVLRKYEDISGTSVSLPLNNISAGIYMITVFDKAHTARLKLVKQ